MRIKNYINIIHIYYNLFLFNINSLQYLHVITYKPSLFIFNKYCVVRTNHLLIYEWLIFILKHFDSTISILAHVPPSMICSCMWSCWRKQHTVNLPSYWRAALWKGHSTFTGYVQVRTPHNLNGSCCFQWLNLISIECVGSVTHCCFIVYRLD